MADVLIRGMEMPKDGRKHAALLQFLEDGKCRAIVEYSKSYDDRSVKVFEAVPLPEGHGRLIDGTDLYTILDGGFDVDLDGLPETKDALLCMIQSAETIVPAEGGGKDG